MAERRPGVVPGDQLGATRALEEGGRQGPQVLVGGVALVERAVRPHQRQQVRQVVRRDQLDADGFWVDGSRLHAATLRAVVSGRHTPGKQSGPAHP